jgi:hypothetical protein
MEKKGETDDWLIQFGEKVWYILFISDKKKKKKGVMKRSTFPFCVERLAKLGS